MKTLVSLLILFVVADAGCSLAGRSSGHPTQYLSKLRIALFVKEYEAASTSTLVHTKKPSVISHERDPKKVSI